MWVYPRTLSFLPPLPPPGPFLVSQTYLPPQPRGESVLSAYLLPFLLSFTANGWKHIHRVCATERIGVLPCCCDKTPSTTTEKEEWLFCWAGRGRGLRQGQTSITDIEEAESMSLEVTKNNIPPQPHTQ